MAVLYGENGTGHARAEVLCVQAEDELPRVALRALDRAPEQRFAPVLCSAVPMISMTIPAPRLKPPEWLP